jgi:hypothetical protein
MNYLKMSPTKSDTLPGCMAEIFSLRFFGPLGLPISPDLLCWWALEVPKCVSAPTSLNIRQTRQTVDPGGGLRVDFASSSALEKQALKRELLQ